MLGGDVSDPERLTILAHRIGWEGLALKGTVRWWLSVPHVDAEHSLKMAPGDDGSVEAEGCRNPVLALTSLK